MYVQKFTEDLWSVWTVSWGRISVLEDTFESFFIHEGCSSDPGNVLLPSVIPQALARGPARLDLGGWAEPGFLRGFRWRCLCG